MEVMTKIHLNILKKQEIMNVLEMEKTQSLIVEILKMALLDVFDDSIWASTVMDNNP